MTVLWMAYAVLITAIAYLAAAAADRLLWIWKAPRRVAWIAALFIGFAAPIAIPVWRGASPSSPVAVPAVATPAAWGTTQFATPRRGQALGAVAVAPTPLVATADASPLNGRGAESTLLTIWLGASACLLLFAVMSAARLEAQSASWQAMELDGTRVLVSPNRGPAVFGFWRQRIVIPSWTLSLEPQARALMLRHEREHLRAGDARYLLAATFAALLFPWNATLWLVVSRLRLAIELDCDDRVLRAHADTHAYGSLLLAVSARRAREMPFAVALIERSSMLERRIRAMTTIIPHRRLLVSMPLLLGVALLTAAATRTPSPRLPSLPRHSTVSRGPRAAADAVTGTRMPTQADRDTVTPSASVRPLPRLATPESLPRISVTWENAPIETVVAAFENFSHRRITAAPGVSGLITATVVDRPWRAALESVMARQGLRVEVRADSSLYISPQRPSATPLRESDRAPSMLRMVKGTVNDAQTGVPISDAQISIAGGSLAEQPGARQLPQYYDRGRPIALSDERGQFSLNVPDGDVSLQACAAGYEFRRIALGPTDSVAVFHGYRTAQRATADTVRIERKDIESVEVLKGQAAAAMYGDAAATGVIVLTLKDGTVKHIPVGPDGPTSVLMIDGAVARDCSSEANWIHFGALRDPRWLAHYTFKIF